ncbi:MAG: hypothetical protein BWY76_02203 [bacterium ADurb.Bin429]|nr:MAG: hypothetical protein BWY76_02203 [bacterium ADurb.Bin429]
MLKSCEDWAVLLSAYLDDEVSNAERTKVEDHLKTCDGCRALAELLRCDAQDTAATLRERGASGAFAAGVMARVAEEEIEPADRYEAIPVMPEKPKWRSSIWEWLVVVGIIGIVAMVMFPVFAKAREKSRSSTCLNNARQIALAIQMYAQDNGQRLPGTDWLQELAPYDVKGRLLDCPTTTGRGNSYVYNADLAGKDLGDFPDPSTVPLVWCTANHNGNRVMAYLDGHVSFERILHEAVEMNPSSAAEANTTFASPSKHVAKAPVTTNPSGRVLSPQPAKPATPTIAPPTKNYGLADRLQIAYKVEVALESGNVQAALERAELLFRQHDGFVLNSNYASGVEETPATAAVSGRVPSENLGKMLVELGALGTLVSRTVNGEDLTAAHLQNLETLGDLRGIQGRVGGIQDRAKPGDALRAEEKLSGASREATGTRIEEYKLQSRVRLAEITVRIAGAPAKKPVEKKLSPLAASLHGAVRGLKAFGIWLLSVLIPIVIFLPVWGPLLWLAIWLWKRYGKRRPPAA